MGRGGRAVAAVGVVCLLVALLVPPVDARRLHGAIPVLAFDQGNGPGLLLPAGALGHVELPSPTNAVAVRWDGPASVGIRSFGPDGWTDWTQLESERDHGPDGPGGDPNLVGPIWTGWGTTAIEVVATGGSAENVAVLSAGDEDLPGLDELVNPDPEASGRTIIPTDAWRSPGWSWANCPDGLEVTGPVAAVIVHHTATTTDYDRDDVDDILRSIHRFHTLTRGWCDIAYQFLIDRFGRIWEGRTGGVMFPIEGGHSRGFNRATTGVAIIGNLDHDDLPRPVLDAVSLLSSWRAAANDFDPRGSVRWVSGGSTSIPQGTAIDLPRVAGHRDVSATSCPGGHAYEGLGRIRDLAAARLPAPETFTFGEDAVPIVGDWDGDGIPGAGAYSLGVFDLRQTLSGGRAEWSVRFGLPGDRPVVGDWDGDGTDTIGVERQGRFHLLTANRAPDGLGLVSGERTVTPKVPPDFDAASAVPIAGDWDGDGIDTLGLVSRGHVVRYADADAQHVFDRDWLGNAAAQPIVGDWNADGIDEVSAVGGGALWVRTPLGDDFVAMHRVDDARATFVVDWTGLGLPTLLTVTADMAWDPTTPMGL